MMRADADALSAVYAELFIDACLSPSDADGLCRTALNAVNAAFAQRRVKPHGMIEFIQSSTPSDIYCHGDLCSLSDPGIDLHLV